MPKMTQLRRIRWAVRLVLILGVAASTTANVLHAVDNPISQTIAAWPPVALLLTIELISRIPVHTRWLAVVRMVVAACIAAIAAWVSYWHMAGVAGRYGETGSSPYLLPLSVDGLIVVASICLVELSGRIRVIEDSSPPAVDKVVDIDEVLERWDIQERDIAAELERAEQTSIAPVSPAPVSAPPAPPTAPRAPRALWDAARVAQMAADGETDAAIKDATGASPATAQRFRMVAKKLRANRHADLAKVKIRPEHLEMIREWVSR